MRGFEAGFRTVRDLVYFWSSLLPGYRYLRVSPKLLKASWAPLPGEALDSDFCPHPHPVSCKSSRARFSFSASLSSAVGRTSGPLGFHCSGFYLLLSLNLVILSRLISSLMPSSRFLQMVLSHFFNCPQQVW